ncbi:MAG: ion transporter [Spirochaetota bacterium]
MIIDLSPIIRRWDRIQPLFVLLSICLFVTEFTPASGRAIVVLSGVIDILFLADFLVRLTSGDRREYFLSKYGIADALGAVPVLSVLAVIPELTFLAPLTYLRFLRILRIPGMFRNMIPLLETRRAVLKSGIALAALCALAAGSFEWGLKTYLTISKERQCAAEYEKANKSVGLLSLTLPDVVYYVSEGRIHFRDGTPEMNVMHYRRLIGDMLFMEIPFTRTRSLNAGLRLPDEAVLIRADGTARIYRGTMISLVLLLIGLVSGIMIMTARAYRAAPAVPREGAMTMHHQPFFAAADKGGASSADDDAGIQIEGLDDIPALEADTKTGNENADIDALLKGADDIEAMMKDMKAGDTPDAMPDIAIADANDAPPLLDSVPEDAVPAIDDAAIPAMAGNALIDRAGVAPERSTDGPAVDTATIRRMIDEALADKMIASEQELSRIMKEVAIEAVKISTKSIVEYIKRSLPR